MSVIRDEIVEEQRGRHGSSQSRPGGVGGEPGGGEAAIETVLMKVTGSRESGVGSQCRYLLSCTLPRTGSEEESRSDANGWADRKTFIEDTKKSNLRERIPYFG